MKALKKGFFTRIGKSVFQGKNYVGSFSHIKNSNIGFMSYIGSYCTLINTEIGKYCSIASRVSIIFGEHPTKTWVSTHPAFYSASSKRIDTFVEMNMFEEFRFVDAKKQYYVTIGNDVWIGSNVLIMNGVKIGDGAIVCAGSVVTKDVEPYSIVGGVPAKIISTRFNPQQIDSLLKDRWWDKDVNYLKERAMLFSDIELYLNSLKEK